jgi:hypothetical protein
MISPQKIGRAILPHELEPLAKDRHSVLGYGYPYAEDRFASAIYECTNTGHGEPGGNEQPLTRIRPIG